MACRFHSPVQPEAVPWVLSGHAEVLFALGSLYSMALVSERLNHTGAWFWSFLLAVGLAAGCGTNTDQPVFPFATLAAVGAPAISSVEPQATFVGVPPNHHLVMEFDLKYYVTNGEDGFLGYNLYMTTSSTSAEAQLVGAGGGPYLPNGTAPSFEHVGASVDTTNIVTQRIAHFKPPPGERRFDLCEKYFFRMTAVIRTGAESQGSPEIGVCAMVDPTECPLGSACNP